MKTSKVVEFDPDKISKLYTNVPHLYMKTFGHIEAIWLCEMKTFDEYLKNTNKKEGSWFYFTQQHMEDNTGLTKFMQNRSCNKFIELGIIERKKIGNPAKNWYQINKKEIEETVKSYLLKQYTQSLRNLATSDKETSPLDTKKLSHSINNITNNNIKEKNHSFSSSSKFPADWKSSDFGKKNEYLHKTYPELNPIHLRFVLVYQENQIKEFPTRFQQYSDKQLIEQITKGCNVINQLEKDGFDFSNVIKPTIQWAANDDFWQQQVRTISALRKKNNNGEMKFNNIYEGWIKATGIDPKVGRYLDEKDFKITDGFEKWDAKTPEEKRKAQDEFVPRRRPPLPPDFKHPENFKPEEIPQFMKDIFNYN